MSSRVRVSITQSGVSTEQTYSRDDTMLRWARQFKESQSVGSFKTCCFVRIGAERHCGKQTISDDGKGPTKPRRNDFCVFVLLTRIRLRVSSVSLSEYQHMSESLVVEDIWSHMLQNMWHRQYCCINLQSWRRHASFLHPPRPT
jgi:hypothetical protein